MLLLFKNASAANCTVTVCLINPFFFSGSFSVVLFVLSKCLPFYFLPFFSSDTKILVKSMIKVGDRLSCYCLAVTTADRRPLDKDLDRFEHPCDPHQQLDQTFEHTAC